MSTELINRITVKKDGVYLSSHSSNDTAPFHAWRCKSLSEIYAAEGQAGLDREIVCMLYEYAQLRGSHKSLDRYRYAIESPAAHAIYKNIPTKLTTNTNRWTKRIRTAYGTSRQKRRRNIEPLSVKCVTKCTLRLPSDAASMTVNTKPRFRTIRRCVKNGCEVSANYRAVSAHRRGGC